MANYGKSLASISASGIQTEKEIVNALRVISEGIGQGSIVVTGWAASTNRQSLTPEITTHSVSVVMDLMAVNKPSTKKKSKKGTVKEPGTNLSLKAVRSVKGVKWKSK